MKKYFKLILLWGIILIFLTGCAIDLVVPENDVNSPATEGSSIDENSAGGLGTGKGTLKIYLTDAPGDYEKVIINISRIEGHIAVDGDEGEDAGWKTLKEWSGDGLEVDLLTLQGVSLLLGSLELAVNHYTQLRVFLAEETKLVLAGLEGEPPVTKILKIPSSENTGIKLNRPFDIVEDGITKLTLDFDAEKSVIETGNGNYKMKPVIHVASVIYSEELVNTGLVSGSVSYYESTSPALVPVSGASVSLSGGEYIFVYNAITLGDGSFIFLEDVPVGNCVLNVDADTDGIDEYSEIIEVKVGENTVVDVVLLAEEPGGISGSVVDLGTTSAIGGATVSVELVSTIYDFKSSAETDVDGNFSLEQLPVGFYTLMVLAEGYEEYNDITPGGIEVTAGEITDIDPIEL